MSEPKAGASERAATGRERAKHVRPDPGAGLLEWAEGFIRRIVREEVTAVQHPVDSWRDQRDPRNPLGPRRTAKAVRRRLAANPNDPCAKHVGDRFLLTPEAIAEEMDLLGQKSDRRPAPAPEPSTPEEEALERVQRRLRRVK